MYALRVLNLIVKELHRGYIKVVTDVEQLLDGWEGLAGRDTLHIAFALAQLQRHTVYIDRNDESRAIVEYLYRGVKQTAEITDFRLTAVLGGEFRDRANSFDRPKFKDFLLNIRDELLLSGKNRVFIGQRVEGSLRNQIIYFLGDKKWQVV